MARDVALMDMTHDYQSRSVEQARAEMLEIEEKQISDFEKSTGMKIVRRGETTTQQIEEKKASSTSSSSSSSNSSGSSSNEEEAAPEPAEVEQPVEEKAPEKKRRGRPARKQK